MNVKSTSIESLPTPAGSATAFALIEALEAEPHLGMTESHNIWNAYAKFARALGGKPMRKWWKPGNGKPQNDKAEPRRDQSNP